jgi:DNA-binding transcriptional LysR family regulator
MLDLNDFFYFVQVVDRGGFSAASRKLRVPKSTLSHRVQELETHLGVRLLNRTSRRFGMTEAGSEFYRHAVSMLQQAEHAETAMRQRLAEPVGTVRFTAAVATAQFAMRDMVADFLVRYPKINVIAHATDQAIHIVGENFDVAIRAHWSARSPRHSPRYDRRGLTRSTPSSGSSPGRTGQPSSGQPAGSLVGSAGVATVTCVPNPPVARLTNRLPWMRSAKRRRPPTSPARRR